MDQEYHWEIEVYMEMWSMCFSPCGFCADLNLPTTGVFKQCQTVNGKTARLAVIGGSPMNGMDACFTRID
jgi:hypothetical protein